MDTKKMDDQKPDINSGNISQAVPPATSSIQPFPPSSPPVPPPSSSQQDNMLSPGESLVVAKPPSESLPFWFYLLFAVVAVIFFFITALLVSTIIKKQQNKAITPTASVTVTSQPEKLSTPTIVPTPVDDYLNSLNKINTSDESTTIEADLESTDINSLKKDLENFQE
ncbi:hypothetical protein A2W14_05490 [Candidatus Gottesmanbacteria bacterium RBG_16_37_8]|uniref:Uncharacterized protein n=1 Tax=Candidatus Gottesmanbacteria bacterium RBG_16_37_8 TaxID=1798371 RepID=A0A1F5YUV1_9BACT|nr:MAG: hypothetical protein A2W14_05490 [Candidatus Gottesmanbacteria bacterium RBG_16_37_8]